jgi:hypothetical protein
VTGGTTPGVYAQPTSEKHGHVVQFAAPLLAP